MIIDILFAIGTAGFLIADMKQAFKLYKNKRYSTKIFSKTHFKVKLFSISCVLCGYIISGLPLAFIVSLSQLLIVVYMLRRITK